MKELPFLEQLDNSFQNQSFQILSIAPHSRESLLAFNSDKPSQYSSFRKAIATNIIKVNILPECKATIKAQNDNDHYLKQKEMDFLITKTVNYWLAKNSQIIAIIN